MQTHKKRFRKKRTIKKQNKKNRRILKGLVCYKVKIVPRSIQGGSVSSASIATLEAMIKDIIDKNPSNTELLTYLNKILADNDKKENILKKILNDLLAESNGLSVNMRDTPAIQQEKKKLNENVENIKSLLNYIENTEDSHKKEIGTYNTIILPVLTAFLQRKAKADAILQELLSKLDSEEVKQQLTSAQIESIKNKINGNNGVGSAALSMVKSSMSSVSNGAVSLGNWLVPVTDTDDQNGKKTKLHNRQRVNFLWFPRKHINYEKGASGTKRNKEDPMEYGDFMVVIEPEEYASTVEFVNQTYHSVEDMLATILMGCNEPFCKDGKVKREPYNWRTFVIDNQQPEISKNPPLNTIVP